MSGRKVAADYIISPELARSMTEISCEIGRQVGVMIARSGLVAMVIVGDHKSITIPVLSHLRTGGGRLRGVRCVHTHLAGEDLTNDDLMDLLFLRLDLMSVVKIRDNGLPERIYSAHLLPSLNRDEKWLYLPPVEPGNLTADFKEMIAALEGEFGRIQPSSEAKNKGDRAILVSVTTETKSQTQVSMAELAELARTADVLVLDRVIQRRKKVNAKFILGKGKLSEVMLAALRFNANLLIFDRELNPSQIRSITDHTELRVIDRTQLILDIFAGRAMSREGKLQVEMAQLKYMLPRLGTRDDALSRLTGGIGGRGPGETRLEVDRRRINTRLSKLAKRLKTVSKERYNRRERRRKNQLPVISLVGYTNAGKSTLLNTLTNSDIIAENKLFATLDPTSRRLRFPEDTEVIITDTVGFIRNLPGELLKSFKSTLEELDEADLLIHVIDISNPNFLNQLEVVEQILQELELDRIEWLKVFNKIDKVDPEWLKTQLEQHDAVGISALSANSLGLLLERVEEVAGSRRI
jgi:GTPase